MRIQTVIPSFGIVSVLCLAGAAASVASVSSSEGSIVVFSDDNCHDRVVSDSPTIPLEKCLPATTSGDMSLSFIVSEKPFCADGSRPNLYQFDDPCCGNPIANWAPDANYGDYGNGSCQHLLGGGFRSMVFTCGDFDVHQPTVISYSFPAPTHSTISLPDQCPGSMSMAPSTTASAGVSVFTSGMTSVSTLDGGLLGGDAVTTLLSPTTTTAAAAAAATTSGSNRTGVISATIGSILGFLAILVAGYYR